MLSFLFLNVGKVSLLSFFEPTSDYRMYVHVYFLVERTMAEVCFYRRYVFGSNGFVNGFRGIFSENRLDV